jgi:hypothetical protein
MVVPVVDVPKRRGSGVSVVSHEQAPSHFHIGQARRALLERLGVLGADWAPPALAELLSRRGLEASLRDTCGVGVGDVELDSQ